MHTEKISKDRGLIEEDISVEYNRCIKESFTVVGKEGATTAGEGFIQNL